MHIITLFIVQTGGLSGVFRVTVPSGLKVYGSIPMIGVLVLLLRYAFQARVSTMSSLKFSSKNLRGYGDDHNI